MSRPLRSRRQALGLIGSGALAASAFATGSLQRIPVALARAPTERRLVVVILRGALDGLAAVPPYADPGYREVRGVLTLGSPGGPDGVLDLDGRFGLHPALEPIHGLFKERELLVFHAVATPYRSRSHFDGQDLLENGTTAPRGARDGWLNRAIGLLGPSDTRLGLAVGQTVPLLLRGSTLVGSWAPKVMPELDGDFLARLAALYRSDPLLGPAIEEGLRTQAMSDEVLGEDKRMGGGAGRGGRAISAVAGPVGKLLAAPKGARIAVMEVGGWDTHSNQGTTAGRLAPALRGLADGLMALKQGLGAAWSETAVAVVSEFGRTAAPNGSGGTDHGTAGIAFLLGGAVAGGRVVTRWPGLGSGNLFEGRDLAPTLDLRAIFKGVLSGHLGLPGEAIERVVFPDSREVATLRETMRRA